jgi:hypothetical protein
VILRSSHRALVLLGILGSRARKPARIPGARELERLFLVGWEVNIQSGKEQGKEQEHDQTEKGLDKPNCRWRYVLCCCCSSLFILLLLFFLFLVSSKYKKVIKRNPKLKFRKPLFSLSPENNEALHMV